MLQSRPFQCVADVLFIKCLSLFFGIKDTDWVCCSLDPSSVHAREGMERVEKHNEMGIEGGYDVEVEDMAASDNEVIYSVRV